MASRSSLVNRLELLPSQHLDHNVVRPPDLHLPVACGSADVVGSRSGSRGSIGTGGELWKGEARGRTQDHRAEASSMAAQGFRAPEIARRLEASRWYVYEPLKDRPEV